MSYELGDTVYVDNSAYGRVEVRTAIVSKVTPSGQITVDFGNYTRRFKNDLEVGADKWNKCRLIDYAMYSRLHQMQTLTESRNAIRDAASKIAQTLPKDKAELRAMATALLALIEKLPA